MNKPLRVGILGYGGMAHYHCERLHKLHDYMCVGVFDTDPLRQQEAEQNGMTAYPSAEALLADKNIDIVLIATPNDWHCPYAVAAAKAGKHIISEKPATLSVAEWDKMTTAADKNGVILTVHQNRRWDRDYLAAKQLIQSGVLGKISRIDSFVCGANGIPGGWRKIKKAGGGMMLDWGVHLIDQIVQMLGMPEWLYCRYSKALGFDVDDGFDAQLGYDGDLTVNVRVDTNTFVRIPRWTVYGRDGTSVIEDWDLHGETILPVYGKEVEIVGIEAGNGFTKTMAYRPHESVTRTPIPQPDVDCDTFYKNFAAAVRGEEKSCIGHESVRNVLRLMELCALSDSTRSVIHNELKKEK